MVLLRCINLKKENTVSYYWFKSVSNVLVASAPKAVVFIFSGDVITFMAELTSSFNVLNNTLSISGA